MFKQKVFQKKIEKFFRENPIIFIYHCNNISMKNWALIKNQLSKKRDLSSLYIQNRIAIKELEFYVKEKNQHFDSINGQQQYAINLDSLLELKQLFQGPTFLLGCHSEDDIASLYHILDKNSQFVFVGGIFETQLLTHLDLKKYITGFETQSTNLTTIKKQKVSTLISLIHLNPCTIVKKSICCFLFQLKSLQYELISCLNSRSYNLQKVKK